MSQSAPSIVEYTLYLDSNSREKKPADDDTNPTNNITLPTPFHQRSDVVQLSLASLEMSLSQYNIEPRWQALYFDEGLDLFVTDDQYMDLIQFVIDENGTLVVGKLPPKLNPILQVLADGPDYGNNTYKKFIFSTHYPHGLALRDIFSTIQNMRVISTPLSETTYYNIANLVEEDVVIEIIDATTFSLDWSAGPVAALPMFPTPVNYYGFLSTPHIADPLYLAALVTAALDQEAPGHWQVSYDRDTGKFSVKWTGPSYDLAQVIPSTLLIPNTNSLPYLMGFGPSHMNIPLVKNQYIPAQTELQSILQQSATINLEPTLLVAPECYRCKSEIDIDPGNYNPPQLMSNVNRQLNRFYFDGGCAYANTPYQFAYSTPSGACFTIDIPFGLYDPQVLAEYLQTSIRQHPEPTGRISDMEIQWDLNAGQFVFSSTSNFGLEFDQASGDLALRMGFYPLSYRNDSFYRSPRPFYFPTKGCCGGAIPDRNLSNIYVPIVIDSERRFVIQVSKPRPLSLLHSPTYNGTEGTLTFTTQINETTFVAHGYQPMDVIEVLTLTGQTYVFVVKEIPAYNQFVVYAGSVDVSIFADPLASVCTVLGDVITTNIYFTCGPSMVLPKVLGFSEQDYLWSYAASQTMWTAPAQFTLDWPNYVLVEITDPNGATRSVHQWETDVKPRILGKLILYPQYRLERGLSYNMALSDLRFVDRITIRLLNPDHTLYEMHGKEWSCSLILRCLEKSIQMTCL